MAEAAVAYYESTGKDKLLNSAIKFADLICDTFNEDNLKGYPGHEIAELALVKLYNGLKMKNILKRRNFSFTKEAQNRIILTRNEDIKEMITA